LGHVGQSSKYCEYSCGCPTCPALIFDLTEGHEATLCRPGRAAPARCRAKGPGCRVADLHVGGVGRAIDAAHDQGAFGHDGQFGKILRRAFQALDLGSGGVDDVFNTLKAFNHILKIFLLENPIHLPYMRQSIHLKQHSCILRRPPHKWLQSFPP
jgi:hypothetical protein